MHKHFWWKRVNVPKLCMTCYCMKTEKDKKLKKLLEFKETEKKIQGFSRSIK